VSNVSRSLSVQCKPITECRLKRLAPASVKLRRPQGSALSARPVVKYGDGPRHLGATALSCGPDDGLDLRNRIKSAVENFIDVRALTDDEVTELIRRREIDVIVEATALPYSSTCRRKPSGTETKYSDSHVRLRQGKDDRSHIGADLCDYEPKSIRGIFQLVSTRGVVVF
jgi:hypothetical protein